MKKAEESGDRAALNLPPVRGCLYLIEWLFECGPIKSGGMGQTTLGWTDIKHWSDLTGVNITGWEAVVLEKLSAAYLGEYQNKELNRVPPWSPKLTEKDRDRVSNQIDRVFSNFKEAKR